MLSSAQNMEAEFYSETLVAFYQTTRNNIPVKGSLESTSDGVVTIL
jgi:hypothetical protein